jgi:hypothetical protein
MPQLQDLVVGAPDSDAARCISDQYNAGIVAAAASSASAVKGSSPSKLPLGEDVAVQELMQVVAHARGSPLAAVVDRLNHHLAEQGVMERLEVQHSKAAAAGSSSSGGVFSTPMAAAAGRLTGMVDAAEQQQLGTPLSEAAVQQPASSPHSSLSGDRGGGRRSSEVFVTHDQLSLALVQRELERVKEKNSLLKSKYSLLESENKAMQQQLSPAVTPLMPSSAYINRTRGSAGTPSPFNHAFGGQPGSGMRFSPPGNAFAPLSAPRSGSMVDTSSAAASSSCFRGVPVAGQQAPGSVGSTRNSPQGQPAATPGTAPGSATSSASRRAVEPVPMQPLDAAGSPAGRPSPVMQQQQQAQGQPAAKQLVEALEKARIKQRQVSCSCT